MKRIIKKLWNLLIIRKPYFQCERCGWKEKEEQEVFCWKCNSKPMKDGNYAEMIFRR